MPEETLPDAQIMRIMYFAISINTGIMFAVNLWYAMAVEVANFAAEAHLENRLLLCEWGPAPDYTPNLYACSELSSSRYPHTQA